MAIQVQRRKHSEFLDVYSQVQFFELKGGSNTRL